MKNLKQILKNKLTEKELNLLPKSYDQVGDIIIFSEFPKLLIKKEKLIANALLKLNKNIKIIAKKTKQHYGKYRLKKVKVISGEKRKTTLHSENKVKLNLNIETCYFSPRLSNERLRIAKLIKTNEKVLVMFSGIAVYSLVIAKNSNAKEIYAIEINPEAHKYALENIKLNKIDKIKLFKGDVRKIIPKLNKKFDRIIMPLPKSAYRYLDLIKLIAKDNTIVHFYDFSKEEDIPDKSMEKVKKKIKNFKVLNCVKCGEYSPRTYRVCLDFMFKN